MITEFLKWIWEKFEHYILPFMIIRVYERGVLLTFGKNPKKVGYGLKWKVPFIQEIFVDIITPNTMRGDCVHITTLDGKTASITPIIEYIIEDIEKWIIETNEAITNLRDYLGSETADYLTDCNWEDCKKKTTCTQIKNRLNDRVKDMGAKVTRVMFADIAQSRVIITQV